MLAAILMVAFGLRLYNLDFGLPSLYDPDEPLFVVKAAELLTDGTLNPRWFGHPGTTTIYLTSLVCIVVFLGGMIGGSWSSIHDFTQAAFADPGLIFLPARFAMVLIAVTSVWLTYRVGRRLHGASCGLVAAALLALNALHISWSQVIRTDIQASMFMLGALYFSIGIARTGRQKDYIRAGVLTGVAIATKWPAATVFVAVIGASIAQARARPEARREELRKLGLAGVTAVAALLIASPFLLLDWQTVMSDLSGEARPVHLGHTGHGFWGNLVSYLQLQVAGSMGWIAMPLIAAGIAISAIRSTAARYTLLPAAIAFLCIISKQQLIWARWILPLLPMLTIFAAVALVWISDRIARPLRMSPAVTTAILMIAAAIPAFLNTLGAIRERENDTRAMAAEWAKRHVPAGSTVALEHLELALRDQPWKILFPIGQAGCIDGIKALQTGVRYDDVNRDRKGAPIVDLGNIADEKLGSCRADYSILSYYDLYLTEAQAFPKQISTYRKLLNGQRTVAVFRPKQGSIGGPTIRIVTSAPR
jgi:4-amino-4-deoxy-L-arabinose transferase-like glycosyltransferase